MSSVWSNKSQLPEFPALENDAETDVLIIGGGIAGILTAFFLHQKGIRYILVEKERICGGTTMNTTAKITFQHGFIYQKILRSKGVEKARMYLDANRIAFEEYVKLCKNTDCDFEIKDNYIYSAKDRIKPEKEMRALEKIGYEAEFIERANIPLYNVGAVCFRNQAQFNPLKFISKISKGLNIFENTFVREMEGTTAVTDSGKIKAKKVIVATHFPFINKHGSYFIKLYQHRSYVIALENSININGMYADESKTGFSFRNYGDLLLLGGGSHRTGKAGGNWTELRYFANDKFPKSVEKYHWATQDCMTLDSVPYIGQYSKNTPDMYVATGFNKWGMTGAMTAAIILSDLITGKENEFSDVFNPSRNIVKPQLFVNGFESAKNLMTISKKRCPHLGCALKWNSTERSWDCSCHGSRFSEDGRVIDNPSNGNLSK